MLLPSSQRVYEVTNLLSVCDVTDMSTMTVSGKGPLKTHYEAVMRGKSWRHVSMCTPWLEAEDYPVLLGETHTGLAGSRGVGPVKDDCKMSSIPCVCGE